MHVCKFDFPIDMYSGVKDHIGFQCKSNWPDKSDIGPPCEIYTVD